MAKQWTVVDAAGQPVRRKRGADPPIKRNPNDTVLEDVMLKRDERWNFERGEAEKVPPP